MHVYTTRVYNEILRIKILKLKFIRIFATCRELSYDFLKKKFALPKGFL
jgi:hypothetical protein